MYSSEAFDTNSDDFFRASDTIFDASSFASDNLRAASLSVCLIFRRTSAIVKVITSKIIQLKGVYECNDFTVISILQQL